MKVSNMISNKGNKIANQFIITDGNKETFQSYNSTIVVKDRDKGVTLLHFEVEFCCDVTMARRARASIDQTK